MVVPLLVLSPMLVQGFTIASIEVACASIFIVARTIVTVKEMRESTQYNISVHSTSVFSWFMPVFWPLTWIPRG